MIEATHTFVLELDDAGGDPLGRVVVEPDWLPAIEHARFEAIRTGLLPASDAAPPARIEPVWHREAGAPTLSAIRVVVENESSRSESVVPTDYFQPSAHLASRQFVDRGLLGVADRYTYRVTAFAVAPNDDESQDAGGLSVETIATPLTIVDRPIEPLLERSVLVGGDDEADPPVFIDRRILEEAGAAVRVADRVETAGILVGRLHRDTVDPGLLFIELTAQIPARHLTQEAMQVTLTSRTWADARSAVALRDRGEAILGWWHSHPDWCRDCSEDRRRECALSGVFFSSDDVALHRTVFPRADHVALLLSDRAGVIIPSLFGWRRGTVTYRGFHVTGERTPPTRPPATPVQPTIGGSEHAATHAEH